MRKHTIDSLEKLNFCEHDLRKEYEECNRRRNFHGELSTSLNIIKKYRFIYLEREREKLNSEIVVKNENCRDLSKLVYEL